MHPLTKAAEVLAELAAGGRIITGDRPGLLMLVDSGGSVVPAWQTALKAATNQLGQAVQVNIRMTKLLKQQLEEAAGESKRSLTAEIIHRLENSLADAVATTSVIECPGLPPVALAPARAGRTYIAGPMTGLPDFNHPAFNAAAAALRAQGRTVINPADHGVVTGAAWADYVRADLALLAGCETIYLLPGWSRSRGALLEHHVARALGMPVEFADGAEVEAEGQMLADHVLLNELSGNSEQLAPAIDPDRIVPPVWLSEQIGGPFDDLTSGQAWRDGFNECRTRTLLLIEQAQQLALVDGQATKGDSTSVALPDGWRVTPHSSPWCDGDRWEVTGPNGGGGISEHDVMEPVVRDLLDALAGIKPTKGEGE